MKNLTSFFSPLPGTSSHRAGQAHVETGDRCSFPSLRQQRQHHNRLRRKRPVKYMFFRGAVLGRAEQFGVRYCWGGRVSSIGRQQLMNVALGSGG